MNADAMAPRGGRVASLDALRGFDLLWILGGDAICRALLVQPTMNFLFDLH